MTLYGQFCPVAMGAEIFAERWTPLILRELLHGELGFNDIHRGLPFPEYVSAHSGQSAASLTTIEAMFGANVPFVDHAHDADGFAPRAFDHIFAAAEEGGISPVYAGIHFMSGNLQERALGECVAAKVDGLSWRR